VFAQQNQQAIDTQLPEEYRGRRFVVAGMLERSGALRGIRLLESADAALGERLKQVLQKWRFRPVLRGEQPVEVKVLLGFGIKTL
jgi:hypothetical protein